MTMSRRTLLTGATMLAAKLGAKGLPPQIDHLLLGCNDLDKGIALVEEHLGVRAMFGGVHPGRGSRNALLSLGERRYLEIIAPDPAQPRSDDTRELYEIASPRLIGWAAHVDDIEALRKRLKVPAGPVMPGSRKRPNGELLQWKTLSLEDDHHGVLPFFIEWNSPHPSLDAPRGVSLQGFAIHSPDALPDLGLDVEVVRDSPPRLSAALKGPRGVLQL
jgi:hypothetical protein